MPKPSLVPPESESRKPPKKIPPTPEQIAQIVTAKLKSPVGLRRRPRSPCASPCPGRCRSVSPRAMREGRKLEALIQEILEGAAK